MRRSSRTRLGYIQPLMRRLIFGALLALCGAHGPPDPANAALDWRSCVDFNGVQCATLDVPLDRANIDAGHGPAPDRAARASPGRR